MYSLGINNKEKKNSTIKDMKKIKENDNKNIIAKTKKKPSKSKSKKKSKKKINISNDTK